MKTNLTNLIEQVNLNITVPKGYIVITQTPRTPRTSHTLNILLNITGIINMLKLAEKNNVVLSSELIKALSSLDEKSFKEIQLQFKEIFKAQKGQFLRSVFATSSDIKDEEFTLSDFLIQINHYFISYGLQEIDHSIFEMDENRKIQTNNKSKRKAKQELNNTFKVIDVKNMDGFIEDIKTIIESPIVWGEQQLEFVHEAHRVGVLMELLK